MKKVLLFLFLVSSISCFSQEDAWVYFKDKPDAQDYLDAPLTMLSQRSIDRRTAQGIVLDLRDVPIHTAYYNQIVASIGITVKAKSKWLNCVHVRGSQTDINALKLLSFVEKVVYANAALNVSKRKEVVNASVNPINKVRQIAVTYNYGNSANQVNMLNGHLLHQLNYTGVGKVIAVLDSGFPGVNTTAPFQKLRDNNQILGGYDFVNKSSDFYAGRTHRTYVLSTMGGFVDGQLIGTAPDAQYYLYITEDDPTENPVEESNWVEAAEEADRVGADIITTSLGYFGYDNANYSHVYSDMTGNSAFASQGANIAFDKGVFVVASAGNEGLATQPHVGVPGEALNVLAVGAVKSDKTYATFSSIGPSYDGRVKPDVMAQGQTVVLSDETGTIKTANGTSFSCPITAGMVACLWQALPTKTNGEIKQLIIQSATNYSPVVASRNQFGYGIPDFNNALSSALTVGSFQNNDYSIFPNPTTDEVTFHFSANSDISKVYIYSISGQQVLEGTISTTMPSLSLKTLRSGVYFYKTVSGTNSKSGKIIKQ